MGFLNFFNKKSETTANTSTNSADNRVVNDASGGGIVGSGNTVDSSTTNNTLSSWLDQSVRDYSTTDQSVSLSNALNTDNSVRLTDSRTIDASSTSWSDSSVRLADNSTTDASVRSWADNSLSFQVNDSSSRDNSSRSWADNSQTTITNTGTDAAAIVGLNAALLQSVNSTQADAIKFMAKAGFDGINSSAQAATNLFQTSSSEASKAWGHTVDLASEAIDKMLTSTRATVGDTMAAASAVAGRAIQSNPDASTGPNVKIALIGAAAVLVAFIISKR